MRKLLTIAFLLLGSGYGNLFAQQIQNMGKPDTLRWYLNGQTFTRMTAKGANKYDKKLFRIEFGRHVDWCDKKGGCPRCGTSLQVTLVPIDMKDIRPEFSMSIIKREPFVLNYTPAKIEMHMRLTIDTTKKERPKRLFGLKIPRIGVYPFAEQVAGYEFNEFSYANGQWDAPFYGGVHTNPFRSYVGTLSIGYRGKPQQRFGGQYGHCDCGPVPTTDIWTLRVQAGYNVRKKRTFAQMFVQYEELLNKSAIVPFGSDLPKYWRPYGATMLGIGIGRQILVTDDRAGGMVFELKLLGTYDMGNFAHARGQGWALQTTAKAVFVGKRLVVAEKSSQDGLERWLARAPGWVWRNALRPVGHGALSAGRWIGGVFRKDKDKEKQTPPVPTNSTRGSIIY